MEELFSEIPEDIRARTAFWIEMALKQKNILDGLKMLAEYTESCANEEEKNYIDFCLNTKLEQLSNESNND